MGVLLVLIAATLFGYAIARLFDRRPFTTADLGVGALSGFAGLALAGSLMGGSVEGALVLACILALSLQTLRRGTSFERVK